MYYNIPFALSQVPKFLDNDFKWNSIVKGITSVSKWGKLIKRVRGSMDNNNKISIESVLDRLLTDVCDFSPQYNQQFIEIRFIPEWIVLHLKEDSWEFDLSPFQRNIDTLIEAVKEVFSALPERNEEEPTVSLIQKRLDLIRETSNY